MKIFRFRFHAIMVITAVLLGISLVLPAAATGTVATVTLGAATGVTYREATLTGNITNLNGAANATERGFKLGTKSGVYKRTVKTRGTYSTGEFVTEVTGLTPGTTYYAKAYARTTAGLGYSTEITFNTKVLIAPTVTTAADGTLSATTAVVGGNVTALGGNLKIRAVGIEYGEVTGVYTAAKEISRTGTGAWTTTLTGLTTGTKYYYNAYAYSAGPTINVTRSVTGTLGSSTLSRTYHESGNMSIALTHSAAGAGSVNFQFVPQDFITLADIATLGDTTEWSFWYKMAAGTGVQGAQIELRFQKVGTNTPDGIAHVDVTLCPLQNFNPTGEWTKVTFSKNDTVAAYYGNDPTDGTAFDGGWDGLLAIKNVTAAINNESVMTGHTVTASAWVLTRVRVELWESGVRTIYIDDVTINGTTLQVEGNNCRTIRKSYGTEGDFTTP